MYVLKNTVWVSDMHMYTSLTTKIIVFFLLLMCTQLIRNLLEDLPRMFAENKSVHSALGSALLAATKLLVSQSKLCVHKVCLLVVISTLLASRWWSDHCATDVHTQHWTWGSQVQRRHSCLNKNGEHVTHKDACAVLSLTCL